MKAKIIKKISGILQMREVLDDEGYVENYIVESRPSTKAEWKNVFESPSIRKALAKKHFYVHFALRHLNYGDEFIRRKKKRKNIGTQH